MQRHSQRELIVIGGEAGEGGYVIGHPRKLVGKAFNRQQAVERDFGVIGVRYDNAQQMSRAELDANQPAAVVAGRVVGRIVELAKERDWQCDAQQS